jgi:hypothetical protein
MSTTEAIFDRARSASSTRELQLEDLARSKIGDLTRIYREARAPSSLAPLHGTPRGRMLTIIGPLGRGPMRRAVAALARASFFPWRGKSFDAKAELTGDGINRVVLLGDRYRFELRYGASSLDGERAILLDYDLPENPWFIRVIHDELRQVSPTLFLGPAMLRTKTEPKLVLFFAIDAS